VRRILMTKYGRRSRHFDVAQVVVAAALISGSTAHAQGPQSLPAVPGAPAPDSAAAAQALFIEGRHLVMDGRYAEGCAKLEQSRRLDPAPGTQINLADCYEKSGKLASAWLAFHEASASAQRNGRTEWAQQARERARALEPTVPRLTVAVDDPVPGLRVHRGGVLLESSTLGSPVPIDPGTYEVEASAPRHRPWSTHVAVEASTHVVLHVRALVEEPPMPSVEGTGMHRPNTHPGWLQRTIAMGTAALAVVPLGIGSFFGVRAISRNDLAAGLCPTSPACFNPEAIQKTEQARADAVAANVSFIVSGALLGTAAGLYFTAPKEADKPSISAAVEGTTVSLVGRW